MKRLLFALVGVATLACGGGGGSTSTPTSPSQNTPPAQTNRNPAITAMSMTAFGMQGLSTFSYSASANDADGDSLTFTWDIAGNPASGTSGTIAFGGGGSGTALLTVTDGKGGTATDTRTFVVGTMTGRWGGKWDVWTMTSTLVQNNAGLITGDYFDQLGQGELDSAVANTVSASGKIRLRYKSSTFDDFIFTGQLDSTGRRITGVVNGSGYKDFPFTITK